MSASYIKIAGNLIGDAKLELVEVTQELNHHWWCKVECQQTEDDRFPIEKSLGQDLQVLTYSEDGAENTLFNGFILDVELEYQIWGTYKAVLTAVTRSFTMDLTERKAYYLEKKLADIAQAMGARVGLDVSVQCGDKRPLNYVQWAESDFAFLNRLADDYGGWLRPTAHGLEILDSFQAGTSIEWRKEDALFSFKIKGTLGQPSFSGAHYNPHLMQSRIFDQVSDDAQFFDSIAPLVSAVREQSRAKLPCGFSHQRTRAVTLDEFERLLKKESVRSIGGNIVASGTSGNDELKPGDTVDVEGPIDAGGTYGVLKVVHRWTPKGYSNEFWCTPWKNYTNPDTPKMRPWFGIVPARVVDHNDPKKMGRIKVKYFWQEDTPAHWARMMTPHAGGSRGFMFLPEVGDEVGVSFEDGDPERPVVLGCFWNGVDQAPRAGFWDKSKDVESNTDLTQNNVKRIVTKSGNRIQLSDKKGQESIVLATPNSTRIGLIENATETGRTTVFIHSSGDILFSAPNGRIHFRSQFFSKEVG
jgi:uncharacterized protein involved in type VI secretion and phage assembly